MKPNLILGEDDEMKNIRKRNDGRYEYRMTTINGIRKSIYAKTLDDLKIKIRKFKQTIKVSLKYDKTKLEKEKTSYKFNELITSWYEVFRKPKIKEKSQESWNNSINNNLIPHFKETNVKEITESQYQMFLNSLPNSRKKEIIFTHLKAFIRYLFAKGILKRDLTLNLSAGKYEKKERKSLNLSEQTKLLQYLNTSKYKNLFYTYLITGCRRSELLTIKKSDINFKENSLFIDGTKTQSAKRLIKISNEFKSILKNQCEKSKNEYLFENLNQDKITELVHKIFKKLNIEGSTHRLRHTAVTNMYYLGIKEKQIQQIVGHANVEITRNIYTHLDDKMTKKSILKLYNNLYPTFN